MSSYNLTYDWLGQNYYANAMSGGPAGFCIHHSAGTSLNVKSAFLANSTSAHYSIKDNDIIQYVEDVHGCWHAGATWPNRNLISIENVNSGGSAAGWPVSETTVDTLVAFLADKCRQYGISSLVRGQNLYGHKDFSATACPGVLYDRLDEIASRVNENIANGGEDDMFSDSDRNLLTSVYNQVFSTNDPTGRGIGLNDHDHIKWIGGKVTDIHDQIFSVTDPTEREKYLNDHDHLKWVAYKVDYLHDALKAIAEAVGAELPECPFEEDDEENSEIPEDIEITEPTEADPGADEE